MKYTFDYSESTRKAHWRMVVFWLVVLMMLLITVFNLSVHEVNYQSAIMNMFIAYIVYIIFNDELSSYQKNYLWKV